jgi:hypothetical protein
MEYFKLSFWVAILVVFAGWFYFMYRMENERIRNNIKCSKSWHSSELYCNKLHDGLYESRSISPTLLEDDADADAKVDKGETEGEGADDTKTCS